MVWSYKLTQIDWKYHSSQIWGMITHSYIRMGQSTCFSQNFIPVTRHAQPREGKFCFCLIVLEDQSTVRWLHSSGPKGRQSIMGRTWQRGAAKDMTPEEPREKEKKKTGRGHSEDISSRMHLQWPTSSSRAPLATVMTASVHSNKDGLDVLQLL